MLDFLNDHRQPVPSWLQRLTAKDVQRGPGRWMERFLQEAIVYPGSGMDTSPIRQMAGVAHAHLFLDFGVPVDQIKQAIKGLGDKQSGLADHHLVAMAQFNPVEFLAGGNTHAPHPPADFQCNSYGFWAVFDCKEGGRFCFMALGAEAIYAMSALYPTAPPKGIVIQEHGFGCNPWGQWKRPLTDFADSHWTELPEWLILGQNDGPFGHQGHYQSLGEDRAVESMHGSWRVIHQLQRS